MPPLSIEFYKQPKGELDLDSIWPGRRRWPLSRINAALTEYRDQGYAQTVGITDSAKQDEAVTWWVYYRAWSFKYDALSGGAATVASNLEGSSTINQEQIDSWKDRRDEALAEYEGLLAAALTPAIGPRSSRTSTHEVRF